MARKKPKILTPEERARLITDYQTGDSVETLAERYGVDPSTAFRIVQRGDEFDELRREQREKVGASLTQYMEAQLPAAQMILSKLLRGLCDDEKIERAGLKEIAVAFGVIVDKFKATAPGSDTNALERLLMGVKDVHAETSGTDSDVEAGRAEKN